MKYKFKIGDYAVVDVLYGNSSPSRVKIKIIDTVIIGDDICRYKYEVISSSEINRFYIVGSVSFFHSGSDLENKLVFVKNKKVVG